MKRPTVTVAIPVYNGAEFLEETLQSVLRQTLQDFEVVISDDGSTDESMQVARKFSDARIRLITGAHAGLAINWNRCLHEARGTYLKLLPQDDLLHPECLSCSLDLLQHSHQPSLAFCRRKILYDPTNPRSAAWAEFHEVLDRSLQPLAAVNCGKQLVARWAETGFFMNCIGEPVATLFPVALARSLGGFATSLKQNLDFAFWIRLMVRGEVCFTPQKLCSYRFHQNNATNHHVRTGQLVKERLHLLEILASDPEVVGVAPNVSRLLRREPARMFMQRIEALTGVRRIVGPVRRRVSDAKRLVKELLGLPTTDSWEHSQEETTPEERGLGANLPAEETSDDEAKQPPPHALPLRRAKSL